MLVLLLGLRFRECLHRLAAPLVTAHVPPVLTRGMFKLRDALLEFQHRIAWRSRKSNGTVHRRDKSGRDSASSHENARNRAPLAALSLSIKVRSVVTAGHACAECLKFSLRASNGTVP